MGTSSNDQIRIIAYQGNTIYFPVNLKRFGVKGNADVSGASAITIEWENGAGVHQMQINVLDSLPGANWTGGIVTLPIDPSNFTVAIDTYTFSLTIAIDGQEVTTDTGVVEVRERPGYPPA